MEEKTEKKQYEKIVFEDEFIERDKLKMFINKWLNRQKGYEEIDYIQELGGIDQIEKGLKTNFKEGYDGEDSEERIEIYGSNKKEKLKVKTF